MIGQGVHDESHLVPRLPRVELRTMIRRKAKKSELEGFNCMDKEGHSNWPVRPTFLWRFRRGTTLKPLHSQTKTVYEFHAWKTNGNRMEMEDPNGIWIELF